jgi:sortase A
MRRRVRLLGTALAVTGVLTILWALVVWQWQDPFTALYTLWKQHQLVAQYARRAAAFRTTAPSDSSLAGERRGVAGEARTYRVETHRGEAIGRIVVPRMGVNMILVDGTDHHSLTLGPGRDLSTYMPGENRLVYIAGHRTTYLAPFSHIDQMRKGDSITLKVPYGTFLYRVSGQRIVPANDLAVLRSPRHEVLILQACHPRFFATHRFLVYAQLVHVDPRRGAPYDLTAAAAQSQTSRK